jgi:integrase
MACISKRRGRWVIDFYDQYGKRRWKTLPAGTTKGQAKEELRIIEDMLTKGVYLPHAKTPTFSEVAQNWLEHKKLRLRESTWECYEGHIRNHLHSFANLKINRITIAILEKFINDRQIHGMNLQTLRKVIVTLGQILTYAVRHKYIDHNPLNEAERPRGRGRFTSDEDGNANGEMRILSPSQITALISQVKEKKYRTLFMLAVFTGARQGELLGLRWGDIDWETNQILIQRTFNNRRLFFPKTGSSRRKIDLGPVVITTLKRWKMACPPNDLNLVFPNKAGKHIDNSSMLRRHFRPALKAAGLPSVRFHDLRHTYASLLIAQGENIKYIQNQLGHASPTITLNVYAHLMKDRNPEAARRLENLVFGDSGSNMVAENDRGYGELP